MEFKACDAVIELPRTSRVIFLFSTSEVSTMANTSIAESTSAWDIDGNWDIFITGIRI